MPIDWNKEVPKAILRLQEFTDRNEEQHRNVAVIVEYARHLQTLLKKSNDELKSMRIEAAEARRERDRIEFDDELSDEEESENDDNEDD